jgi:hypothetical protein
LFISFASVASTFFAKKAKVTEAKSKILAKQNSGKLHPLKRKKSLKIKINYQFENTLSLI